MSVRALKVWDLPTRLCHWSLVALVAMSWWSGEQGGEAFDYHQWSGYGILSLLLFRLAWGVVGGEYSRFAQFVHGPRRVLCAVRDLLTPTPLAQPGHNPLGGWMVLVLLLALLFQAGTGLFANDDILIEGPLASLVTKVMSDRLTGWHYWNFNLLLALAAAHVLAVLYHAVVMKENLIGAMFTGVKRLPADAAGSAVVRFASSWFALVLFAVAALAVYLIVKRPF